MGLRVSWGGPWVRAKVGGFSGREVRRAAGFGGGDRVSVADGVVVGFVCGAGCTKKLVPDRRGWGWVLCAVLDVRRN